MIMCRGVVAKPHQLVGSGLKKSIRLVEGGGQVDGESTKMT